MRISNTIELRPKALLNVALVLATFTVVILVCIKNNAVINKIQIDARGDHYSSDDDDDRKLTKKMSVIPIKI